MTTDLFGNTPDAPSTEDVDLTEVNQKFGDDIVAIKKAKAHADLHIKNMEKEQAELRKELETRLSLEQFMDEIKSSKAPSSNSENHPGQNESANESVSRDDISKLVKETINQERSQLEKNRNRAIVAEGLQKVWGSSFQSRLEQRARELGMTREQFNELASASPQGFLAMVIPTGSSPLPSTAPPVSDRSKPVGSSAQDVEFFKKMRKEDPSRYWSPTVQKQIHRLEMEASARGESFYS